MEVATLLEQVVMELRHQAEDHPAQLASQHTLAVIHEVNGKFEEAVNILEPIAIALIGKVASSIVRFTMISSPQQP